MLPVWVPNRYFCLEFAAIMAFIYLSCNCVRNGQWDNSVLNSRLKWPSFGCKVCCNCVRNGLRSSVKVASIVCQLCLESTACGRKKSSCFTVWKFQYFSVIQILREINFGEPRSAKSAILTHLKGSEF